MLAEDNSSYVYHVLSGHRSGVNCLDFCKDGTGNLFASGSDDATCRLWDLRSQKAYKCLHQCFDGHAVDSVAFHPPCGVGSMEHRFYAASGQYVYIFDLRKEGVLDKEPLESLQVTEDGEVDALAVDPTDGKCLVAGDSNGRLYRLRFEQEQIDGGIVGMCTLLDTRHPNVVSALSFRSGSHGKGRGLLISGCLSGQLSQTDVDQDCPYTKSIGFCDRPLTNEGLMMETEEDGGKDFSQMINPPLIYAVESACDGACIVSANGDGAIYLFDAETMACEDMAEQAHGSIINALHIVGQDGTSFLSAGTDKIVQAWDIRPDEQTDAQWDLCSKWKLLHPEKVNAISGPRTSPSSALASPFIVADISKDIRVYCA